MSQAYANKDLTEPERSDSIKWMIRPYQEGDIPAIAALTNAADAVDRLGAGRTEEELRRSFAMPLSDPPRQVILLEGPSIEGVPAGMPLGFGRLLSLDDDAVSERIYQFGLLADPGARSYGAESVLAKYLLAMARPNEDRPETKNTDKVW